MFCENCFEPSELVSVVRRQRRALRQIVKHLRRTMNEFREQADGNFIMLCETETDADKAIRELWESGLFKCGPQDYDQIVKQSIDAIRAHED